MSDEEKKEAAEDLSTPGTADPEGEESGSGQPAINLDRYMSRRRTRTVASWMHLTLLVGMLATLILLFLYKDRCGRAVSGFIYVGAADAGLPAGRIQLEPGAGSGGSEAPRKP